MAYEALEDLEIYQIAEQVCDRFYELVSTWTSFDKETVGTQLVRAADSVGANIAESYGRYHHGEKLNFLYYARGSLYETKYWVRRCRKRELLPADVCDNAYKVLNDLGVKLNSFIAARRKQRNTASSSKNKLAETRVSYEIEEGAHEEWFSLFDDELFDDEFINDESPNNQSPNNQSLTSIF